MSTCLPCQCGYLLNEWSSSTDACRYVSETTKGLLNCLREAVREPCISLTLAKAFAILSAGITSVNRFRSHSSPSALSCLNHSVNFSLLHALGPRIETIVVRSDKLASASRDQTSGSMQTWSSHHALPSTFSESAGC